jgi:hypothetical protein
VRTKKKHPPKKMRKVRKMKMKVQNRWSKNLQINDNVEDHLKTLQGKDGRGLKRFTDKNNTKRKPI